MWRRTLVLAVAACGSRSNDTPPKPAPSRDAGVAVTPRGTPAPAAPPFEIAPPADKLLAVGRDARHACVVRASGAVDCWGTLARCEKCELGAPPDPTVRRIPGISDAINISANGTCIVRRTGEAACLNDAGTFDPVPGVTGAIASDPAGTCFVGGTGGVTCVREGKPWKVPGLADAIALAASDLGVCAVRKTGRVMCGSPYGPDPWAPVRGLDGVTALAMTGRMDAYGCAVMAGKARCFSLKPWADPGQSIVPEFVHDDHSYDLPYPERFAGATEIVMWELDNEFHLAANVRGKVVTTSFSGEPTEVPLLDDTAVLGRQCAIRAQGSLVCWGANDGGSLAQPTTLMKADVPPTTVVGLSDVVDIGIGLSRSYALTRDGRAWWWGRLWKRYSMTRVATPVELKLGLGPTQLAQVIATEDNEACMRSRGGEVWCQADYLETRIEQLDTDGVRDMEAYGQNVVVYRTGAVPQVHKIAGGLDPIIATIEISELYEPSVAQHVFNYDESCTRHEDGTVHCPSKIEGITAATQLALGGAFGCVVQRGRAWCWLDAELYKRGPLSEIPGLRDVTDLAASPESACAVHGGGRVSCWTFEEQGRDGDKHIRRWSAPVEIIRSGAVDVELGQGRRDQYRSSFGLHGPPAAGVYGCARMVDRTVQCWGMNIFGEIGDGSLVESATPIGVKL